jgi:hypothetical protein
MKQKMAGFLDKAEKNESNSRKKYTPVKAFWQVFFRPINKILTIRKI